MKSSLRLAGFALFFALGASAPALACELDTCDSPPLVLPETDAVPVNAFLFELASSLPQELRLTDFATNAELAASEKWVGPDRVWSPDVALQVGQRVQVSYRTRCEPATVQTRAFTVAPAASLDQKASVEVTETRQDAPHGERQRLINVAYRAPTAAESYLRLRVEVDGYPYDLKQGEYARAEQGAQFWTRCDVAPNADTLCGGYDTLTARQHEVKFIARALGSDEEDVQTITVDLRCDKPEGCQLGGSSVGGLYVLLALWLRRRRYGTSSPSAASTSARV